MEWMFYGPVGSKSKYHRQGGNVRRAIVIPYSCSRKIGVITHGSFFMKKKYLAINVLVPLLIGAVIYYLFFPKTIFVALIDKFLGFSYHITINPNCFVRILRCYLLDFLWAYAFTSFVVWILEYKKWVLALTAVFMVSMELLQLFFPALGTFDIFDILAEIVAGIIAVFISRRRIGNEKN